MPHEIPVVFHNGSNSDYHFFYERIRKRVWGTIWMSCGKYRKYWTFSVLIEKEVTNIDKDANERVFTISYKIKFIDITRFMASSLWNLVDNVAEGTHKIKCKDFICFFEYETVKEYLIP